MKLPYLLCCLLLALPGAALALETNAKQAIIVDDSTGTVLLEKNADEKMHPSSMSKLMTVYMAFKRLKEGSLKLTDTFPVSERAWRIQGSKMFVELGNSIPLEDLLQGIIIQSGNDACIVVAEGLAGSEEAFAAQMNEEAKRLGMTGSHFTNASGWPDEDHLMTARDLAILGKHLVHDFPEYYHYFAQKEYTYHGIKQGNRNLLLYRKGAEVDGLKTGHTEAGGFGMVVTAKDAAGRRIIAVINGLPNMKARAEEAEKVLAHGFRDFESRTLLTKGQKLGEAKTWYADRPTVPVVAAEETRVTLPKGASKGDMAFTLTYQEPLQAPVKAGDTIGELRITSKGEPDRVIPLVAGEAVQPLTGFARAMRTLKYYLAGA